LRFPDRRPHPERLLDVLEALRVVEAVRLRHAEHVGVRGAHDRRDDVEAVLGALENVVSHDLERGHRGADGSTGPSERRVTPGGAPAPVASPSTPPARASPAAPASGGSPRGAPASEARSPCAALPRT